MKKIIFFAIIIAITMGCSSNKREEKTTDKRIKVITTKVVPIQIGYNLRYSGTVEASQTIPLTFQTNGIIDKVYVEVGDAVKKGQILATVDNSDMLNIYNTMQAKYNQAKDAYDRLKAVYDQGSLTEIKWAEMKSNYEQAKSSLDLAKNNLEKCKLYAPVDGYVGRRNIEPGQSSISISIAPIELVKIEIVYVKISVPENEISKINKGMKASLIVSALNEKQFEGTITNISPIADAISRTYNVKITVNNPDIELKPGMVCDVTLNLNTKNEIVLIPYNAISTDNNGKPFVYVVSADSKCVKKQNITTGNYHESGIEVLSGLATGQTIVLEGKDKLSDNSLISL